MEQITNDPDYFRGVVEHLSSKTITIGDDYIEDVFQMGHVNRHASSRTPLTPEERFSNWSNWQREAFTHFMEESRISEVYSQLGYDFEFIY